MLDGPLGREREHEGLAEESRGCKWGEEELVQSRGASKWSQWTVVGLGGASRRLEGESKGKRNR